LSQFSDKFSFVKNGTIIKPYFYTNEIQHKLEKALLEIEKLSVKVEKAELETKYWREKCEK
jgi:hypothetical protein